MFLRLYPGRMSNHFYRLVLNVQEELNTEDDPCVENIDYNFQVLWPLSYFFIISNTSFWFGHFSGLCQGTPRWEGWL